MKNQDYSDRNPGYGKTWKFCDECGCILHRTNTGHWEDCPHDWRPNSAFKVLENQEKELDFVNPAGPWEHIFSVRCYQSPVELQAMMNFVYGANRGGMVIVEIGSFHGGTAHIFSQFFPYKKLICIDRSFDCWLAGDIATQIEGDTRNPETLELLKKELNGQEIDFLFIDGDHSREGALNDWEKFSPLVRDGGIIAFHDTHAIPEVTQVFNELPGKLKLNIVSYQGIGVIVK